MEKTNYERNVIKQCFSDNSNLLYCLERVPDNSVFNDDLCKLLWQAFQIIQKAGQPISSSTIIDVLRETGNHSKIEPFEILIKEKQFDELQWKYHLFYLCEQWSRNIILEACREVRGGELPKSSEVMAETLNVALMKVQSTHVLPISFKNAYKGTLDEIREIYYGHKIPMIYTGHDKFDSVVALSKKKYILLAAQKKIGKTRFMVDMVDRIINNNSDVAIQFFSMEMTYDELIRCFMSRKTKIEDRIIMGKNKDLKLTQSQLQEIEIAAEYFDKYPIEIIDKQMNIFQITSKFTSFVKANPEKTCICVIDNLALIKPHIDNDVQFEDDVARMLKQCRDETEGIIIMLHHLTKESESKWNKDSGYEPKVTHIRGSSRLVDLANQVILLHRPDQYPDLVEQAINAGKGDQIRGLFVVDVALNREGSSEKIIMRHQLAFSQFEEK